MDIAATFDEEPFRHSDPKYKTCCGMHVKDACKLIAVMSVIGVLCQLVPLVLDFSSFSWSMWIFHLLVAIGLAVVTVCLFWALKKENEKFLLPYIGFMAFAILATVGLLLFSLWSLIDPQSERAKIGINYLTGENSTHMEQIGIDNENTAVRVASALVVALCLASIALCIWFVLIVYKYFTYLVNMKKARNPKNVVHHENHEFDTLKKEKNGTQ